MSSLSIEYLYRHGIVWKSKFKGGSAGGFVQRAGLLELSAKVHVESESLLYVLVQVLRDFPVV